MFLSIRYYSERYLAKSSFISIIIVIIIIKNQIINDSCYSQDFKKIDSSWALVLILGVHTSRIFCVCVIEKANFNSILPLTNVV